MRGSAPHPGALLGRLLLASVLVFMGGMQLWAVSRGVPASGASLTYSAAQLVLGLRVAGGWRLRWSALLAAVVMAADAAMAHAFWPLQGSARDAQLLHFMHSVGIAGGFVLLAVGASGRRR